ncbi:FG-GAP repeat protein [Lacipirellula parvula]|uniref:PEP-CTERM protein-sorting domain-containing protein n=1 Tax=Lacipirellula parvula TaxID=2650471 RepID=A0A5K7X960_9BACT|nr:FG-GAP repeat protein [Lacipirellula parvula]BBO33220.1 hypothetical protein PLANPX_2832 [Lacipirellula parvula]
MRSSYLSYAVFSAFISFSFAVGAFAAPPSPTPLATFHVPGLATNDYLGWSLATDGQRVLVGTGLGSAYLYDPFTQQQLAKVTLPSADVGTSVALQGDSAVIAGTFDTYVYNFADLTNISKIKLTPSDYPGTRVGFSVDMSGDVVIAAAAKDPNNAAIGGAAYLFDRVTGNQIARLVANDGQENDGFGVAVAIDEGRAAVAALQPLSSSGGAVYLFDAEPSTVGNRQLAKYAPAPGLQSPGQFGYNVDLNDETLVATQPFGQSFIWPTAGTPAPLASSSGNIRAAADGVSVSSDYVALGIEIQGLVRIYDKTGKTVGILAPPPGSPIGFGLAVAIEGDLLAVSAGGGSPAASTVYVYRVQDVLVVPEPSSVAMTLLGVCGVAASSRRRPRR